MATADALTPAILAYLDHGAFPDSDTLASTSLGAAHFPTLLAALRREQEAVKEELRARSRAAAPDLDGWLGRARELKNKIGESREAAHGIGELAARGEGLRGNVEDAGSKVELLEKEVAWRGELESVLEGVAGVRRALEGVQAALLVVGGDGGEVRTAMEGVQRAEGLLAAAGVEGTSVGVVLERRLEGLRAEVRAAVESRWEKAVVVNPPEKTVTVKGFEGDESAIVAAKKLGLFEAKLRAMERDLIKWVVRPRLTLHAQDETVPRLVVQDKTISCAGTSADVSLATLFADLTAILEFLNARLPPSVAVPLSEHLVPALTQHLHEDWLSPSLPLDVADVPAFQDTLAAVVALADRIDALGWHGAHALRDWEKHAPRAWLTKRREAVLGDVRNLVFVGLRKRKIVERVETQVIPKDEGQEEGGDDWDDAWDEPAEPAAEASAVGSKPAEEEDDEASAWVMDNDDDENKKNDDEDDGEAWGWDDGDAGSMKTPDSPKALKKKPSKLATTAKAEKPAAEQEITYRETYMVTAIPEGIMELLRQVVQDAQTLAGEEYSSSPIAPAATALYTLPTLALAIYRATAPTAYSRLESGSILIYNDATHLSEQLRTWQASQPAASRLRLDADVKTLDQFAKRAYGSAMDAQRTILRDLLDGAQGFSNCTTPPFKAACESAVADTVHHLRQVHKQWQPILSSSALSQSIGNLLAALTGKMIADIVELPDISEPDSKQIRILCERVSEVKDLFTQADPQGEERDMTFIYCPTWMKFQYLAEIMESSLADIKYLWNEGELSLEFDAEEVVGLIEALFAESALRRAAIVEVRKGGRR